MFVQADISPMYFLSEVKHRLDHVLALAGCSGMVGLGSADLGAVVVDRVEFGLPRLRMDHSISQAVFDCDPKRTYGHWVQPVKIAGVLQYVVPITVRWGILAAVIVANTAPAPNIATLELVVNVFATVSFPQHPAIDAGLWGPPGFLASADLPHVAVIGRAPGVYICKRAELRGLEGLPSSLRAELEAILGSLNVAMACQLDPIFSGLAADGNGVAVGAAISIRPLEGDHLVSVRIQRGQRTRTPYGTWTPGILFKSETARWKGFIAGDLHGVFGAGTSEFGKFPFSPRLLVQEDVLRARLLANWRSSDPRVEFVGEPAVSFGAHLPPKAVLGGLGVPGWGGWRISGDSGADPVTALASSDVGGIAFAVKQNFRVKLPGSCECIIKRISSISGEATLNGTIRLVGDELVVSAVLSRDLNDAEVVCCGLNAALVGGLAGAAVGAAIGFIGGPAGAIVGAGVGASLGLVSAFTALVAVATLYPLPDNLLQDRSCVQVGNTFTCTYKLGFAAAIVKEMFYRGRAMVMTAGEGTDTIAPTYTFPSPSPALVVHRDDMMLWDVYEPCSVRLPVRDDAPPKLVAEARITYGQEGKGALEFCAEPAIILDPLAQYSLEHDAARQEIIVQARDSIEVDPAFASAPSYPARVLIATTGGVRVVSVPLQALTADVVRELLRGLPNFQREVCGRSMFLDRSFFPGFAAPGWRDVLRDVTPGIPEDPVGPRPGDVLSRFSAAATGPAAAVSAGPTLAAALNAVALRRGQ